MSIGSHKLIKVIFGIGATICLCTTCMAKDGWSPKDYSPKVSQIYSVNSTISNCFYKPKLSEIVNLTEYVIENGGFAAVYDGTYDLGWTNAYKPAGTQTRALEILGYDFLLQKESYTLEDGYKASLASVVTYQTAIMDIYKALGKEQYDIQLSYSPDSSITMETSPVVKNLPSYLTGINTSCGRTDVFVTRTNPSKYMTLAESDIKTVTKSLYGNVITCGDFLVLLQEMMHLYGEPVISTQETNELLQAYGSTIPMGIRSTYKDAMVYLKARGVLNIELDLTVPITVNQIADILMCVKDTESRTDYKKIVLTKEISSELVSKGYYPTTIDVSYDEDAVQVEEFYDYSTADKYDYLVNVPSACEFKTSNGVGIANPYIPENESYASPPLDGTEFLGIEDGFYHFRVPISYSSSKNEIIINTSDSTDTPKCWILPVGGGIYTTSESGNGEIEFDRVNFENGEYTSYATKERKKSRASALYDLLSAVSVHALADSSYTTGNGVTTYTATDTTKVVNKSTLASSSEVSETSLPNAAKAYFSKIVGDRYDPTYYIVANGSDGIYKSEYIVSTDKSDSLEAIATLQNDVLFDYKSMIAAGLVTSSETPKPEDGGMVLRIPTKKGNIILNQRTHEIRVGTVVYRVPTSLQLFEYTTDSLMVDFRVVYGWASDKADITYAKSSSGNQSMSLPAPSSEFLSTNKFASRAIYEPTVLATGKLSSSSYLPTMVSIKDSIILSSNYYKASWVIYQAYDSDAGQEHDYLINYYNKDIAGSRVDDESDILKSLVGYSPTNDNWVVRVTPLDRKYNSNEGEISYISGVGYVYNVPSKWSLNDYLNGDIMLPIVDSNIFTPDSVNFVDMNLSTYECCEYEYGLLPMLKNHTYSVFDLYNKESTVIDDTNSAFFAGMGIYVAPAGVQNFYGSYMEYSDLGTVAKARDSLLFLGNDMVTYNGNQLKIVATGISLQISNSAKVYRVAVDSGGTQYFQIYDADIEIAEDADVQNKLESIEVIVDDGANDVYEDDFKYRIKAFISAIDDAVSMVITITFYIVPYAVIVLLTMLVGISVMADNKFLQLVVSKTIDPVKILTFGRRNFADFRIRDTFISLIIAYLIFGLLLRGNFFRILLSLIEWYNLIIGMLH